jgi:hypothetical protein
MPPRPHRRKAPNTWFGHYHVFIYKWSHINKHRNAMDIHTYIYTIIVTICYKHIYIYDIIWYHHWSHKAWSHRPRVVARITLSSLQPSKSLRVAISGTTAWPAPWAPAARSKGPRVRLSTKYLVCPVTLQGYTTINRHIIWRMTCISWTYPWHTVCGTRKGPRYKLPP